MGSFLYFAPALMIRSVPSSQYASAYRLGAHATREHGDAVLYVNKCSPVSQLVNSIALPRHFPLGCHLVSAPFGEHTFIAATYDAMSIK